MNHASKHDQNHKMNGKGLLPFLAESKWMLLALGGAILLSACGGSKNTESSAAATTEASSSAAESGTSGAGEAGESSSAATESSAEEESISEDDPDLAALESTILPEKPALEDMGSIKLPDLSTLEVSVPKRQEVTDEQVEDMVIGLLGLEPEIVDDAAKLGDTVNIDFLGKVDGVAFAGGEAAGYSLTLGSHQFVDTFEDQLVGFKAGEKTVVTVTFPEQYTPELAGKVADFDVTINSVSRAPEPTDEDVKNYSGTETDTVEAFYKEQRENLEKDADYMYKTYAQQNAYNEVLDNTEFEISDALMEYGKAYVIRWYVENVLEVYGMNFAEYANSMGFSKEEFLAELDEQGEVCAKETFMVDKILADQNITLTDELIYDLADDYTLMYETPYDKEKLIEELGEDGMEEQALNNAAVAYIESQVKFNEE